MWNSDYWRACCHQSSAFVSPLLSWLPVVLVTQHDLVLADPALLDDRLPGIANALCKSSSNVKYILLNRDSNNAPRTVTWLQPQQLEPSVAAVLQPPLEILSIGGRFSDQTHFAHVGWYRKAVLGPCAGRKTCMEHVLHEHHGGSVLKGQVAATGSSGNRTFTLDGSTYLLGAAEGSPMIRDLVHGSMVPTASLEAALGRSPVFKPLAAATSGALWHPHPFSVVMWDAASGKARGALNYAEGDASKPAQAIFLP